MASRPVAKSFYKRPIGPLGILKNSPTTPWAAWFGAWQRDRKSTRLNSSHVTISYATVCTLIPYTTLFRSWVTQLRKLQEKAKNAGVDIFRLPSGTDPEWQAGPSRNPFTRVLLALLEF